MKRPASPAAIKTFFDLVKIFFSINFYSPMPGSRVLPTTPNEESKARDICVVSLVVSY